MIHLESIEIYEFRGIHKLHLELKGKNFAVCGHNGTGKSGIVDALEFGLTGNISRLSGEGTGAVSVKDHAPHVDSRNKPDKARVVLRVSIPSLRKTVIIDRNVKEASTPKITPADPNVLKVLEYVASHPEFVLSRRELIRYILSAPGERAKQVQALLRLDRVEGLRALLLKIANSCERGIDPLKREESQANQQLLRALDIPRLETEKLLEAVNNRRSILGLSPIATLTVTTSLKDGLATTAGPVQTQRIPKVQATADIKSLRELLAGLSARGTSTSCELLIKELTALSTDPLTADNVTRERLLRSALNLINEEACPVCGTFWKQDDLRKVITDKLRHFEEITQKIETYEKQLEPLKILLNDIRDVSVIVERYGTLGGLSGSSRLLHELSSTSASRHRQLENLLPLQECIAGLQKFTDMPIEVAEAVSEIEAHVNAIPEPTQQDAARDYLTVCQERLEVFRGARLQLRKTKEEAALTRSVYDVYVKTSTDILGEIYKEVEKNFTDLYRYIHREDEGKFEAHLIPSIGKLGFDVDFYGRGLFPPGAYHSEGHQDSMGLCLYLALMKHLLGNNFTSAILDDILMSVDSGHRREVCNLLKEHFPDTQFVLTTHDEIWLKHMQVAGLVTPEATIHFRKWNVTEGPIDWNGYDVWHEIENELKDDNIHNGASQLRHYLEYVSKEICHRLRAPVEFRGDGRFELGDLLPSAIRQFKDLLKRGEDSARSWGKTEELESVTLRKMNFEKIVIQSNVEQWQVNRAIHFNEWANLRKEDFTPVVEAQRKLVESFVCSKCDGFFYVIPPRGRYEVLRCSCADMNVNLRRK
ncbi:MAG: AAA family ATPase [Bacteroidota bacterium]